MAGMWLWWVIGIAIVAGIVWAVLRSSPGASGNAGTSAEELLKRRYAQGDIDQDEYENVCGIFSNDAFGSRELVAVSTG